jgi:hypothetical protein
MLRKPRASLRLAMCAGGGVTPILRSRKCANRAGKIAVKQLFSKLLLSSPNSLCPHFLNNAISHSIKLRYFSWLLFDFIYLCTVF